MQNLSTMIWGMARLAEHPGPGLIRKYLQKLNELLDTANFTADDRDQGIPNTLWALAVLDELHPDFVERVGCLHLLWHPASSSLVSSAMDELPLRLASIFEPSAVRVYVAGECASISSWPGHGIGQSDFTVIVSMAHAVSSVAWAVISLRDAAQAYEKLPATLQEKSHNQVFQAHLYLEASLPAGQAPRLPRPLLHACQEVAASTCLNATALAAVLSTHIAMLS